GVVDEWDAGCLRDERDRARRTRVRLEHVQLVAGERELQVQETARAEGPRDARCGGTDRVDVFRAHARRGEDHGRVTRVTARPLDVLEDRGYRGVLAVAEDVDVELDGICEETVD